MITLRKFQQDCHSSVMMDLKQNHKKIAVVAPTGSGKTTVFGAVTKDYLEQNPTKKVVIVSHLSLLISQTKKRLKDEWSIEGIGILQADTYPDVKDRVILTTMQSFRSEDKIERWKKTYNFFSHSMYDLNIGLIIIDETHFAGCESYLSIMEMFPNAQFLGFTATPFRANKLMTNMFDKVSYTISMQELIDQGYLVPPVINMVPFDTNNMGEIYSSIIAIYKKKHLGKKAVVYLRTIEDAVMMRNLFVDSGITSSAVTSEVTGEWRDEVLDNYRGTSGVDVLTTVDVLTAGFDSPNVQVIFMPYKMNSVTTFLQRIGRGLRPWEDIKIRPPLKKTHCDIYIGSDAPSIDKGFWEKVTKQMLLQGNKENYENYLDIVEFGENDFSGEEYAWTKEVVDMANDCRNNGMAGLFDMIITQELPKEMLDIFIDRPPLKDLRIRASATVPQAEFLKRLGLYRDGLTKHEASALITCKLETMGRLNTEDIIKEGMHKGKHYSQVPRMYWNTLRKRAASSNVYQGYLNYNRRVSEKLNSKKT